MGWIRISRWRTPRCLGVRALVLAVVSLSSTMAVAATFTVNSDADAGAGTLRDAITMMNAAGPGPHTIEFDLPDNSTITLASSLPPLTNSTEVAIDGATTNNLTIDGDNVAQVFLVQSGEVTISDMTIQNGLATGGNGGAGAGGGGGGLGAGGALFVAPGAEVTIDSVEFADNQVAGGAGGQGTGTADSGGGGGAGVRGDGGAGAAGGGGGGGGLTDGSNGSGTTGGAGGAPGGSGGNNNTNGVPATAPLGGGGGGGAGNGDGGNGLLGGGGGGAGDGSGDGGAGGFGGGAGGDDGVGGGGGSGFGGAVFNAGTLTIIDSNISGGSVAVGPGGTGSSSNGANGSSGGTSMFLQTGNTGIEVTGTMTIDDQISGAGGITKTGAGTLELTAGNVRPNNYTGGTTLEEGTILAGGAGALTTGPYTVNGGTLDMNGNGATMTALNGEGGEITSATDATLTVDNSATSIYGGGITGAIRLVKDGSGFFELTAENGTVDYTGGTLVSDGILVGNTDSLQGDIENNAEVLFDDETGGDFTGNISGTGNVTIQGGGTFTFTGINTYAGDTTIFNGTLQSGGAGSLASGPYDLRADATLDLAGDDLTMTSLLGDEGSEIMTGGAILTVDNEDDSFFDGNITGGGELIKSGAGFLSLAGNNEELTKITVENGELLADSEDAFPDGIIYEVNGGILNLNDFDLQVTSLIGTPGGEVALGTATLTNTEMGAESFDGIITGEGNVVMDGPGEWTLNGLNTYTGETRIEQGTLIQGIEGAFSAESSYVVNDGLLDTNGFDTTFASLAGEGGEVDIEMVTLTIDSSETASYEGVISGTDGELVKRGTGTQTLAGNNTYTGPTTVEEGRLNIDGEITSNTTVEEEGTLGGSGTIIGDVDNDGTVSPGASPEDVGRLTIDGNFNNSVDGTVEVGVDGVDNSVLDVNGTATLDGGRVLVSGQGANAGRRYTFLTADMVAGEFDEIEVTFGLLEGVLEYTDTTVSFVLLRNGESYEAIGRTFNQRSVGRYLDFLSPDATGDLQTVFDSINSISDPAARAAFDQLSGAIHGTMSQLAVQNTGVVLELISERLRSAPFAAGGMGNAEPLARRVHRSSDVPIVLVGDGVVGGPLFEFYDGGVGSNWTPWAQGFGMGGQNQTDGNAAGAKYDTLGTVAGLERWLDHSWLLGIYGGYVGSNVDRTHPRQRIDGGQVGAYLYTDDGCSYMTFLGGFEWDGYKTDRPIVFGDIDRRAKATSSGWQGFGYIERGMSFRNCNSTVQPFIALQYVHLERNKFTETGADSINLALDEFSTDSLRLMPGARLQYALRTRNGLRLLPEVHALWVHEFLDSSTAFNARFAQSGGSFIIEGLDLGQNWALLGTNMTWELGGGWSVTASYDAWVNDRQQLNVGAASIGHLW